MPFEGIPSFGIQQLCWNMMFPRESAAFPEQMSSAVPDPLVKIGSPRLPGLYCM